MLVGEWTGSHDGNPISMVFKEDGTLVYVSQAENLVSESSWRLDETGNQMGLDLFLKGIGGAADTIVFSCIVRFLTVDKIQVRFGLPDNRPQEFLAEASTEQLILIRQR
jgi:hypothetical protein